MQRVAPVFSSVSFLRSDDLQCERQSPMDGRLTPMKSDSITMRLLFTLSFLCALPVFGAHLQILLAARATRLSAAPQSSTYFVDSQSGSDANDGKSGAHPWRTLDKLNATIFQPGDSIVLKAGSTWEGQLWPKGSGSADQPIRLGSYGSGAKPLIHADGKFEDALLLRNQEYWEVQDLELTNSAPIKATRRGVHLALQDFGEAHHLVVRHMSIHDVSGRDDAKNNGAITFTSDGEKTPSRFVDVVIEDNTIHHVDRNGISSWSDRWERSKWFPSLVVVVRGNHLDDIGGDGIMIAVTDGALIERNVVGNVNQRSDGYNIAIWSWSADNTTIQFNEAYGTKGERDGEGFDSDWNSRNTIIQYNYSHDNDGGFLLICNEGGEPASASVGNVTTIVRYNISQNDRHRGIALSGPVQDTRIYNNTFYIGKSLNVDAVLFTDWNGWPAQTVLFNNIFYAAGQAKIGHATDRDKTTGHHTSAPGFGPSLETEFDSNVYFGKITAPSDPRALTQNPLFSAPGKGSSDRQSLHAYGLKSGSPARATGRRIPDNGGRDFFGGSIVRCQAIDRGAIQRSKCDAP